MLKQVMLIITLVVSFAAFTSLTIPSLSYMESSIETKVNWMTWEEAVAANKKEERKIIIDLYTTWCGWCKKMDKSTFSNPEVVDYINDNFYAVKLDAETKRTIQFDGHAFKYIESGRSGVNELAYALVDGKLSYPTIVYLNPNYQRILISPGYKEVDQMKLELRFVQEEVYTKMSWNEFIKRSK